MLNNMQWFNQPKEWEVIDASRITMFVTPKTDFWRVTNYGFVVDDGPFYYMNVGGEFELQS